MPRVTILGSGLALRPLGAEHAPALVRASADGNLSELQWTNVPNATNVAEYIGLALEHHAQGLALPFVMEILETGKIVGTTRIFKIDLPNRAAEIGHTWIAGRWQRSFVNTESKYLLLRYAFEEMKLIRVQLYTDENNTASRAAILRLGAKEEGILRKERIMADGRIRTTVVFSIIDDEWPAIRARLEERLRRGGVEPTYQMEAFAP
ncbi:GCN5-related N-acetyltransferase [Candidatus Koribacter versatilis Ellin345]|uniref:GCN5-related N-acetyltransferase n=1 Tax=Koribacter versatilis (strain Ellin345) TaxID=204669 RepID=Q1IS90_KORVE|nr:GNAT family protein [Candidatus Koribacter versatilis]ABF40260.1 GCN5-related N-acetyltransferase [Candidatus Koribacter versatilis Ellin345]